MKCIEELLIGGLNIENQLICWIDHLIWKLNCVGTKKTMDHYGLMT